MAVESLSGDMGFYDPADDERRGAMTLANRDELLENAFKLDGGFFHAGGFYGFRGEGRESDLRELVESERVGGGSVVDGLNHPLRDQVDGELAGLLNVSKGVFGLSRGLRRDGDRDAGGLTRDRRKIAEWGKISRPTGAPGRYECDRTGHDRTDHEGVDRFDVERPEFETRKLLTERGGAHRIAWFPVGVGPGGVFGGRRILTHDLQGRWATAVAPSGSEEVALFPHAESKGAELSSFKV